MMKSQYFKSIVLGCFLPLFCMAGYSQTKTAFAASTTPTLSWQLNPIEVKNSSIGSADIEINLNNPQQTFRNTEACSRKANVAGDHQPHIPTI